MKIILASASPRRRHLLELIGLDFAVEVSEFEEDNTKDMRPEELAMVQAMNKAIDVSKRIASENAVVIGADTIVVIDGRVFGKPQDYHDAVQMLTVLAGREHIVISGVAVVKGKQVVSGYSTTSVKFRPLSLAQIKRYVDTGEPLDKAGAYAIQGRGALLVEGITGCYNNVVGLPLVKLSELLEQVGVQLL
ncbi:Maf family protein [Sporomusa acidovorans]|uniref:dTTP/UTP pyrophosphatase n=1 Tax=Sporomusa acidovorans (strain ATCC 49682 / DSM 3132 / Mol) TaxID=1123286 RepID=A0ABZ3J147_SPOA4|nr:Maf family protein [Sporomusa acidovorans]OZC22504.1 septum formation protein Maf [Sporomusa acidovorans DSM 3132]SDE73425.1 septum formation protein [Sporomusa acidovorans]